jgi:hypothetical protein
MEFEGIYPSLSLVMRKQSTSYLVGFNPKRLLLFLQCFVYIDCNYNSLNNWL